MRCPSCNKNADLIKSFSPEPSLLSKYHCHSCRIEIIIRTHGLYHPLFSQKTLKAKLH